MHEFGYAESLLPVLEQRAEGRRVTRVGVRAGILHRLVEDSFQLAFDTVAAGTVAEGATIELEPVPLVVSCEDCGQRATAAEQVSACPHCGSVAVTQRDGDEFTLHWIDFQASS